MNDQLQQQVLKLYPADSINKLEKIQTLWSGYGEIARYELTGAAANRVVIKHVQLPDKPDHPRGWDTQISHQRKIKSYQVESAWYDSYAQTCDDACRVPRSFGATSNDQEFFMVLEDLDLAGYPIRKKNIALSEMIPCLSWLAHFHAKFMGMEPERLWAEGTYWHLNTRPDELEALQDTGLKACADEIDRLLRECPYQTFIHGDAKLANFCFSSDSNQVAAVDFQYVGGGCGMKDLAYFIGSCLFEDDCERYEEQLLDIYFDHLKKALEKYNKTEITKAIEPAWRPLFHIAWADFHRFVKGWNPGHWKIHSYSERITAKVLKQLNNV